MAKPYKCLRKKLREFDIDQTYLCKLIGRSSGYLTERMMAHKPWSSYDMYKIMDELDMPYEDLHIVFPNYRDNKRVWPEEDLPIITKRDAATLLKAKQIAEAFNITLDDLAKNTLAGDGGI